MLAKLSEATDHERESVLASAIGPNDPNPIAWYLLAFDRLHRGQIGEAARAFGMAYHQDVSIESAALLTFACLKTNPDLPFDLLDQIVVTWREMRCPLLGESTLDRTLIRYLMERTQDIPRPLTALGQVAWLAAGSDGRERLSDAQTSVPRSWNDFFC